MDSKTFTRRATEGFASAYVLRPVQRRRTSLNLNGEASNIQQIFQVSPSASSATPNALSGMASDEQSPSVIKDSDDLLRMLDNSGPFQIIQYLVFCCQFFSYMNEFSMVYFAVPPVGVLVDPSSFGNSSYSEYLTVNQSHIPDHTNINGSYILVPYRYLKSSQSCIDIGLDLQNTSASLTYIFTDDRQQSIVSDMGLICGRTWIISFSNSIFFVGALLASLVVGWLADAFGRRSLLLYSNALYAIFSTALIFSHDPVSFCVLRFCIGVARQGITSLFWVLMIEWAPPAKRAIWAAASWLFYALTILLLGVTGYFLLNWHHLQAFIAAASIVSIPLYWFAPESLKWLLIGNRPKEVFVICVRVAKFNRMEGLPADLKASIETMAAQSVAQQTKAQLDRRYSVLDCLRTPYIRLISFASCYIAFATMLAYYGMTLLLGFVFGNLYVNFLVTGALEFVPRIVSLVFAFRLNHRTTLLAYTSIAAAFSIIAGVIPSRFTSGLIAQTVLIQVARMCLGGSTTISYLYTSELYPTVIRNTGFSLMTMAVRAGAMLAPVVDTMDMNSSITNQEAPLLFMGLILILLLVAVIILPETKGTKLLNTIEDTEAFGKANFFWARSRTATWFQKLGNWRTARKNSTAYPRNRSSGSQSGFFDL